jgi:FecR protein
VNVKDLAANPTRHPARGLFSMPKQQQRGQRFGVVLSCCIGLSVALGTAGALASTPASALSLSLVGGSVEVLGRAWEPVQSGQTVTTSLRTGTGRAVLVGAAVGKLTVGSSSALRVYQGQPDVQSGRFYTSGDTQFYAFGTHLAMQGQLRVDIDKAVQRAAVIAGTLRISRAQGGRAITIRAGEQYNFATGAVTAFKESDPWYLSQFVGEGEAALQASRGSVQMGPDPEHLSNAALGQTLATGSRIKTGKDAWAEVGFSGGGYLRLQAESQLKMLGVEKTDKGREVLLQLESGSAWNVVQKGQGGYQLSTPTVTTAVRGTVFRVDADGLVKVFDGKVALPSQGDAVVGQNEQRATAGGLGGLKKDALDTFNIALDAERAKPTVLEVPRVGQVSELNLTVKSNPGAKVSVSVSGQVGAKQTFALSGQNGTFTLQKALPEGRYRLTVRAARPERSAEQTQALIIDTTPPTLTVSEVKATGAVLTITGSVSDNFSPTSLLRAELGGQTYTLHASGAFNWTLPLITSPPGSLKLSAGDDAGNKADARLP